MKYAYRKIHSFTKRAYEAGRRARKYKAAGNFTRRTIENLYVSQRGKCNICLIYLNGRFEIDHIQPLSKYGSNNPDNIQLLCSKCNKIKGDRYGNQNL